MNNVIISPNIKRVSERIDPSGNVINPVTKQVVIPNTPEYIPTVEDMTPKTVVQPVVSSSPLSIQQQIDEAKENLLKLEELKKLKIEEMKAQLALLEQ